MRLFHLIKKETIEIVRQKELLVLLFLAPLIQIIVLGYVVNTEIRNVPIHIIDSTHSRAAARLVDRIAASGLFRIVKTSAAAEDPRDILKTGEAKAVLLIRNRPGGNAAPLHQPEFQIVLDGVDSNTALISLGYINGLLKRSLLEDIPPGHRLPLIETRTIVRFNPDLKTVDSVGPAIVALLLTVLTLLLTALSVVREREQQTLETLVLSRLTPFEIYAGKAIPPALVGLIQMIIGTLFVGIWFGIPLRGSFWVLILSASVYLLAISAYGLIISAVSTTHRQAMFYVWFSLMTFFLLSGFLTPLENIPPDAVPARLLAALNPFRYLVHIFRNVFLKGNGLAVVWTDLAVLAAMAAGFTLIAFLKLRKPLSR